MFKKLKYFIFDVWKVEKGNRADLKKAMKKYSKNQLISIYTKTGADLLSLRKKYSDRIYLMGLYTLIIGVAMGMFFGGHLKEFL